MKSFTTDGFWGLTDSSTSDWLPGHFSFDPDQGLKLILMGSLGEISGLLQAQKFPVIYGIVDKSPFGKFVTLLDSFQTQYSSSISGFTKQEILSNRGLIGDRLLDIDTDSFQGFCVNYEYLSDWVNLTGFEFRMIPADSSDQKISISYQAPPEIQLSNQIDLNIDFSFSQFTQKGRDISIVEDIFIKGNCFDNLSWEVILDKYVRPIQDFLTLATNKPNKVISNKLICSKDDHEPLSEESSFHLLMNLSQLAVSRNKQSSSHDILFNLTDLVDPPAIVIDKWLDFYERYRDFCKTYFSTEYLSYPNVELKFFTIINSIELFANQESPHLFLDKNFISQLHKQLMINLPNEQQAWIEYVVPWKYKMNLPWLLLELMKKFPEVMSPITSEDPADFVRQVVDVSMKAYQRDPTLVGQSNYGVNIHWMTEKIKILLRSLMLSKIGFSSELIIQIMKRNRRYEYLKTV